MSRLLTSIVLVAVAATAQRESTRPGALFERVADVLRDDYHDRSFARGRLPGLIESFEPAAGAAESRAEERAIIHAFLRRLPASHLALYSNATYRRLMRELRRQPTPTLGFHVVQRGARFFVHAVFEGGPGDRAGVLRGDRVVAIEGVAPGRSPRLDWRTDDAWLDDAPLFSILCESDQRIEVTLASLPGESRDLVIRARPYSGWRAAQASTRVIDYDGQRFGYLHLWYVHDGGCGKLLLDALRGPFRRCDGFVLDLRGRGGRLSSVYDMLRVLERELRGRSFAALIDRDTRSAKEIFASEIRQRGLGPLVGERTAGAVLPAAFVRVAADAVLMLPDRDTAEIIETESDAIEGRGVAPDVEAPAPGRYARGRDPILDAGLRELSASTR